MSSLQIIIPLGVLSVMDVVFNSIVLYLVYKNRTMRTPTNGFVVSLAISDILTGLVIFLQYLVGFKNAVVINVVYAVVLICGAANLTAVTADRYIAVTMPFSYHSLMTKYSKTIIGITWLASLIIALLPLCWQGNVSASYHKIYILMVVFICIIAPFLFILFANVRIFIIVRNCIRSEQKTLTEISNNGKELEIYPQSKPRSNSVRSLFSEAKIAKVFVVAAIAFAITWFPVLYYTLAAGLGHYKAIPSILLQMSPFTIVIGSLANPIIYSFMKPDFRAVVKALICHGKACKKELKVKYQIHKSSLGLSTTGTTISRSSTVQTEQDIN